MAPIALQSPMSNDMLNGVPSSGQALLSSDIVSTLKQEPHLFLQPSPDLHLASLSSAKSYIEPLASSIATFQQVRNTHRGKKRKRRDGTRSKTGNVMTLTNLHTHDFEVDQVWGQASKILQTATQEIRVALSDLSRNAATMGKMPEAPDSPSDQQEARTAQNITDWSESDADLDADIPMDEVDGNSGHLENESLEMSNGSIVDTDLEEIEEEESTGSAINNSGQDVFVPDKLGLNDGFFSIDDFNKQSDFLEQRDVRGEDDGAATDEEDIDWEADPLVLGPESMRNEGKARDKALLEGSEDEDDGPIFDDAHLDSLSDSEIEHGLGAADPAQNTNDILYNDFFAPPPRELTKTARRRALPKTQPSTALQSSHTADEEIQRAITDVHRDIFEDDLEPDEGPDGSESDSQARSSHQRRQAKVIAEIRRLESEAVAKKPWTLSGEARAGDRPLNSLLEENLEFERVGKPVPVITQEVTEDIEALIKRRIINREFDEVIRRRPGTLTSGSGKDLRRGKVELEDSKSSQGLADLYEAEHLQKQDPEGYVDKRTEKLKKDHEKITELWKDVSSKLDALTNLHFKPKPVEASVKVISDVPTIMMEDARPNADVAVGQSMLAPQEVYKAGESRDKVTEISTRSGLPVAREEMTREQKLRRRRREKERIRKAGASTETANGATSGRKKKVEEKQRLVGDLKQRGVKVIGRKGEIRDLEGKEVKGHHGASAGTYKL